MHLGNTTILSTTLVKMWVLIQDLSVSVCVCVCVYNTMYVIQYAMYTMYNGYNIIKCVYNIIKCI